MKNPFKGALRTVSNGSALSSLEVTIMLALEQLTLSGAVTLLTYLQHSRLEDETVGAIAIAASICEILSQLEAMYPGITSSYGWQQVHSGGVLESGGSERASPDYLFLDDACYSDFKAASLS